MTRGGVFYFAAREPEAEELLKSGLAKPLGRPGGFERFSWLAPENRPGRS